jgi:acetyltransferase-like isoleucine patch superfamily enzyme
MLENRDKNLIYLSRKEMYSFKNYIRQGLFQFLYAFVKNLSFPLFNYLRFLVFKLFAKELHSTYISESLIIWFPWNIEIGKHSSINAGCMLNGTGGIKIGNDVRIASYTVINSIDHEFENPDIPIRKQAYWTGRVTISDDVWIGANVIINKGVTIGEGSIIGAGSVVTKDIPPYSVAVGVPCKVIRNRKESR